EAIDQTAKLFNWDHLYLGGGNTKKIEFVPGKNIKIVSNEAGLLGGVALWREWSGEQALSFLRLAPVASIESLFDLSSYTIEGKDEDADSSADGCPGALLHRGLFSHYC